MNLVKKLFKRDANQRGGNALAKRERGGPLARRGFGFDRDIERMWRDFDRDPWSVARDPWSMLDRMSESLTQLNNWPAIDVSEDGNAMTVRCDVPGLDVENLDVQVSGNVLTISGAREDEWDGEKRGVHRRERVSGSFSRSVPLPSHVDGSKVEAKYDKGTLTITVPKIPGKGPRRVQVKAS
jgi:HSP20 family protein